ncbi:uncharacterized protein LOC113144157 isoform X2 [Mastacembelus armatus]|uniref:uncharacterized protein LOC113144157 isoform X2 n=1 Tax=Mastacembelus armatus TaxID=205130 RepID=UPI000E46204E|nr:uncharacterized protein LOC113144157 isoform X2 [Mastacembelus armatus]
MGSTGSRIRLRKVTPCNSPKEEGGQLEQRWTLPALPVTREQTSGSLGQRTNLPPLKQEMTLSTLSEPYFAGSLLQKQSIIHSHPPRRPQALQPMALQIGHTSTASQIAMCKDSRDGGVHHFSATSRTGHAGTGRMIQGGFLEAQTALAQQALRYRHLQIRQAKLHRKHKVIYSINVRGNNTDRIQRVKLVKRPTERDIFWDETTGESLDPSCLLEPESLPLLCEETQRNQPNKQLLCKTVDWIQSDRDQGAKNRQGEKTVQQIGLRGLFLDKNLLTAGRETERAEHKVKIQRDSWMCAESTREDRAIGRIRGARGIWDSKLE